MKAARAHPLVRATDSTGMPPASATDPAALELSLTPLLITKKVSGTISAAFDLAVTRGLPPPKRFVGIVLEATMPSRADDSLAQAFGYQTAQQTGRQHNA